MKIAGFIIKMKSGDTSAKEDEIKESKLRKSKKKRKNGKENFSI